MISRQDFCALIAMMAFIAAFGLMAAEVSDAVTWMRLAR